MYLTQSKPLWNDVEQYYNKIRKPLRDLFRSTNLFLLLNIHHFILSVSYVQRRHSHTSNYYFVFLFISNLSFHFVLNDWITRRYTLVSSGCSCGLVIYTVSLYTKCKYFRRRTELWLLSNRVNACNVQWTNTLFFFKGIARNVIWISTISPKLNTLGLISV